MSVVPRVVQCRGDLGCSLFIDLGVDETLRGTRAIDHVRYAPEHVDQPYDALTRLAMIRLFPAS